MALPCVNYYYSVTHLSYAWMLDYCLYPATSCFLQVTWKSPEIEISSSAVGYFSEITFFIECLNFSISVQNGFFLLWCFITEVTMQQPSTLLNYLKFQWIFPLNFRLALWRIQQGQAKDGQWGVFLLEIHHTIKVKTRIHPTRMRIVRCSSRRECLPRGVCLGGVCQGGCLPGRVGCLAGRGCLPGWVFA